MDELLELFPTREAFDAYWNEHYVPVTYEDVKSAYEDFVRESEGKIFVDDYEKKGVITREDFMDNLNQTAKFTFQDSLTEAFYEKNSQVYENAFSLYEMAQMTGDKELDVAQTFHEEYNRLYREFLLQLFEDRIRGNSCISKDQ